MNQVDKIKDNSLLDDISSRLKEEKWTRAAIDNYSRKNFEDLDELIEKSVEQGISKQLKDICINYLNESKQNLSIVASYIAGILNYENEKFNDPHMEELVQYFQKNEKWKIVEYLCIRILSYGENTFFLTALETSYLNLKKGSLKGNSLKKLWIRLCQVDYENGETPKKLALYYEKDENNIEKCIHYYKMALIRFAKKENFKQLEEIWGKLLYYIPEDLDFFFQITKEIAKYNQKKSASLLNPLLPNYLNSKDPQFNEIAIKILRKILNLNPSNREAREMMISELSIKYNHHNLLKDFIEKSNLNNFNINVNGAFKAFQRYIQFEKGKYVYHRSWKVGIIEKCEKDDVYINFEGKKNHKMSMEIALFSLKVIEKDHIWIKKKADVDVFKKLGNKDIKETLITLFKSYNNNITIKEIKKEMVEILGEKKWLKWWNKARQVMKMSSIFGISQNAKNEFFLRDKPLSFEEESYINFKSAKKFYKKFEIMQDYLKNSNILNSEEFREMLNYFVDLCNNSSDLSDKVVHIFLFLKKIQKDFPAVLFELKLTSSEVVSQKSAEILDIYNSLEELEFRKILLKIIKKYDIDWKAKFIYLLRNSSFNRSNIFILELLFKSKDEPILNSLNETFIDIINNYRTSIGIHFWLVKFVIYNTQFQSLTDSLEIERKNLIFNLFHSLDILNKKIVMKKVSTLKANRKLFSNILLFLSQEEVIDPYIGDISLNEAKKVLAIINSLTSINSKYQSSILKKLFDKHPVLRKKKDTSDEDETFITTQKGYEKKQKELQYLINVEIPKNSRAIGIAKEKGDLKENSEYSAALEHQKHLQKVTEALSKELEKAKILTKESIPLNKVSPGSYVEIQNMETNKIENYTILGEAETDLENNIISYKSPFGKSLLGHKVKDEVHFTHGGIEKHYVLKKIERSEFI